MSVDFTLSYGGLTNPASLHYGQHNQYTTAIKAVANIIQDYDSDRLFPCYGFGAKVGAKNLTQKAKAKRQRAMAKKAERLKGKGQWLKGKGQRPNGKGQTAKRKGNCNG